MELAPKIMEQLLESRERGVTLADVREQHGAEGEKVLAELVEAGQASWPRVRGPIHATAFAPDASVVAERLRELFLQDPERLRSESWLTRALPAALRAWLPEALKLMRGAGEIGAYHYGNRRLYAWLPPAAKPVEPEETQPIIELYHVYQQQVAEQGGFRDVPLADLHRALRWPLTKLHETVHHAMKQGWVTLRRASTATLPPDWSEAAIRLPGEAEPMVKLEWLSPPPLD